MLASSYDVIESQIAVSLLLGDQELAQLHRQLHSDVYDDGHCVAGLHCDSASSRGKCKDSEKNLSSIVNLTSQLSNCLSQVLGAVPANVDHGSSMEHVKVWHTHAVSLIPILIQSSESRWAPLKSTS